MKALYIYFLLFCISGITLAQNDRAATQAIVEDFTSNLEARGITDWFIVNKYCNGSIEMFKMNDGSMCSSKGTYYEYHIIWKEEGMTMIKKIDNCGMFFSRSLSDNVLWEYAVGSTASMEKQSVKPYEADISGEPKARTAIHPCYREYDFHMNGATFNQKYNLYQLTTDASQPNKNFEFNNQLKLIQLHNMIEPILDQLKNSLKRQE